MGKKKCDRSSTLSKRQEQEEDRALARVESYLEKLGLAHEWRRAQSYDGVLGWPPAWVPKWHQEKFANTRNDLLDNRYKGERVDHATIITWLDRYRDDEGYIPSEVFEKVDYLAHLRWAVSLGPKAGLRELAGKTAVHGQVMSQGRLPGAIGPLLKVVVSIVRAARMNNQRITAKIVHRTIGRMPLGPGYPLQRMPTLTAVTAAFTDAKKLLDK